MKRIFVSLFFLLPLAVFADDYGVRVPEWKDFAPKAYIDVEAPKGVMGKFNVTAKYWYDRKLAFEEGLANCQSLEAHEERFGCYEELKIQQFRENTDYNARIEAKMQTTSGIPEMNNRADTMLPINGYMNNYTRFMQNELR